MLKTVCVFSDLVPFPQTKRVLCNKKSCETSFELQVELAYQLILFRFFSGCHFALSENL